MQPSLDEQLEQTRNQLAGKEAALSDAWSRITRGLNWRSYALRALEALQRFLQQERAFLYLSGGLVAFWLVVLLSGGDSDARQIPAYAQSIGPRRESWLSRWSQRGLRLLVLQLMRRALLYLLRQARQSLGAAPETPGQPPLVA
jgi:hypothetical protein